MSDVLMTRVHQAMVKSPESPTKLYLGRKQHRELHEIIGRQPLSVRTVPAGRIYFMRLAVYIVDNDDYVAVGD